MNIVASIIASIFFAAIGIAFIIMGVLGALKRLPPNYWFGYRLPSVAASREAWVQGHRAAAFASLLSGISCLLGGVGLAFYARDDDEISLISLIAVCALALFCSIGSIAAHLAAKKELAKRELTKQR